MTSIAEAAWQDQLANGTLLKEIYFPSSMMFSLHLPPFFSDGRQLIPFLINQESAAKYGDILLMSPGLG